MHLGVDLGGTKTEIVALSTNNEITLRERIDSPQGSYQETLKAIVGLVQKAENQLGTKCSLGIGIPGSVSPFSGRVQNANSTWLIGQPIKEDLSNALDRDVAVANDADCFTLSEANDGAAKNAKTVFGVILGTGVGGGISINKQIIVGPNAITGEWGHNPMPTHLANNYQARALPSTKEQKNSLDKLCAPTICTCYCGQSNCIETFLSGPGFLKRVNEAYSFDLERMQELETLGDDAFKIQILDYYIDSLARALSTVINIFDPNCIVLGGGLSNIPNIYPAISCALQPYVFSEKCITPVLKAKHGDSSGVRGAAWLGRNGEIKGS